MILNKTIKIPLLNLDFNLVINMNLITQIKKFMKNEVLAYIIVKITIGPREFQWVKTRLIDLINYP